MKKNSTQQEILLLTGTNFTSRQWCTKDDAVSKNLTEEEKLEEACWNGLLPEMLPELCGKGIRSKKMFVWQIKEAASFLELELGEYPAKKDNYYSIDPYSFLAERSDN